MLQLQETPGKGSTAVIKSQEKISASGRFS